MSGRLVLETPKGDHGFDNTEKSPAANNVVIFVIAGQHQKTVVPFLKSIT